MNLKRGFGILEVLASAVILGFLIVGLTRLQLGNREGILRVRARDAANVVAQEVIDSISALGSASVLTGTSSTERERTFKNIKVPYLVTVDVKDPLQTVNDETDFIKANVINGLNVEHQLSKQVDVTVKWKFKNSDQSINVSAIVK